jgi:hypothetical protein
LRPDGTDPKGYEPDYVAKVYKLEIDAAFQPVLWRMRTDAAVALVALAVASAADSERFRAALDRVIDYVHEAADAEVLPREAIEPLVENVVRRLAGQNPPALGEARLRRLPSISHQALFVVLTDADADVVRNNIGPGQIWVNATDLDHEAWRVVGSIVPSQRRRLGKSFGHPGRPKGSMDPIRDKVARQVAKEPNDIDAWVIVLASGLKAGPLHGEGYTKVYRANREYLRRLRAHGAQLLREVIVGQ